MKFLGLLLLAVAVSGQFTCDDVHVTPNFDMERFLGRWDVNFYMVPVELPIELGCLKLEYTANEEGSEHEYTMDMSVGVFGTPAHAYFNLDIPDKSDPARWITSNDLLPGDVRMFLLHTDYDNFAMYGTCFDEEAGPGFGEIAIFSRNHTEMTDDQFSWFKDYLNFWYGIPEDTPYLTIAHEDCPQWFDAES